MKKNILHIAITGGAGQIAYQFLFHLASGEVFGNDQKIALHILEIKEAFHALQGVKMELEDSNFPLLDKIVLGVDPKEVFQNIDYAFLIGAKPRSKGMERKDLLLENAAIFIEQGKALNEVAKRNVKVFVIGNPCNTNAWITMKMAPEIPSLNFFCMTTLDENRAKGALARKANESISLITCMTIWGNHSLTQVPDYFHAKIRGLSIEQVIHDHKWLQNEFMTFVQKRGAEVIEARGKSSAASAARAIINMVHHVILPTKEEEWFSLGVNSKNNPYKIEEDLIFSFPCKKVDIEKIEIIPDLSWNPVLEQLIRLSEKELIEEKTVIKENMRIA